MVGEGANKLIQEMDGDAEEDDGHATPNFCETRTPVSDVSRDARGCPLEKDICASSESSVASVENSDICIMNDPACGLKESPSNEENTEFKVRKVLKYIGHMLCTQCIVFFSKLRSESLILESNNLEMDSSGVLSNLEYRFLIG